MKALLTWFTICVLAGSAVAQTATTSAQTPPKKRARRAAVAATPAPPAVTADDLKALKDSLAQQQQQIQELQSKMAERDATLQQTQQQLQQAQSQLQDAQGKAAAASTTANQTSDSVTKLQSDVADIRTITTNAAVSAQEDQKKVSTLESAVARFRLSGDVRVRQEDFSSQTNSGCGASPLPACNSIRARERIRLRLGFEGRLSEDVVGGLYVASGAITDPTTTNETLTNVFERKTIAWDRGWITYNPQAHKWLSLTGGKFAYTWTRTSVTFDPDLNPEGFSEKFNFDIKSPLVKNFTLTGFQLLYNEVAKGGITNGLDSYALGEQISTKLTLGKRITFTPSYSLLKWVRPDIILNESPVVGGCTATAPATTCAFAPNGLTNNTFKDFAGVPRFVSGFLYSDVIAQFVVLTPAKRLPFTINAEYEQNLNAKPSTFVSALGGGSFSKQDKAYLIDASLGQQKQRGDVQFGYEWRREEQDAAIASFVESDQRTPTNVLQNRIYFLYRVRNNTTLSFTDYIGRTLNTGLVNATKAPGILPGQQEPYLNRAQFDAIYTF